MLFQMAGAMPTRLSRVIANDCAAGRYRHIREVGMRALHRCQEVCLMNRPAARLPLSFLHPSAFQIRCAFHWSTEDLRNHRHGPEIHRSFRQRAQESNTDDAMRQPLRGGISNSKVNSCKCVVSLAGAVSL